MVTIDNFPPIKMAKVKNLIPYVNNSRTHSEDQIAQVAASIKEFGFTNPILVDGDNGVIAGHGRLMAARKLGMEEVPTLELAHLSQAQKKAYIIADNKLAQNAGWDKETLVNELDSLEGLDFDISVVGFNSDELSALRFEAFDIEEVDHFNESYNVAISCEDDTELATLQMVLGIGGKKIDAKRLLGMVSK